MTKSNYTKEELLSGLYGSAEKHGIKNFGEKLKWLREYWKLPLTEKSSFKELREMLSEKYQWMNPEIKIGIFMEEFKSELERLNCPIKP